MTVAVVCYNNQSTIQQAIKSVERQEMSGVEILVIDDCSTDNTAKVVQSMLDGGSHFRFLSTGKNSGSASAARNIAIKEASGEYLTFLDGDDELYPGACFNLYTNAVECKVDIVTAQMVRRRVETGRESLWHGWLFEKSRTLESADDEPDLVYDSTSTNKTYSVAFLRDHNLGFTEGVYFEDNEFSQHAFAVAKGIRIIPDRVYVWNVFPDEDRLTITSDWRNVQSYSDRIRAFESGYRRYGERGQRSIQRQLLNKTVKHDIWLFIDRAFDNNDFATLIKLWEKAIPVIELLTPEDLQQVPLKQRAKIATLLAGDLKAFAEAKSITSSPKEFRGYIDGGVWLPTSWEKDGKEAAQFATFLAVGTDSVGAAVGREIKWVHRATQVKGSSGRVEIKGTTRDNLQYFDHSAPLKVFGRLMMNGGDIVQTVPGEFESWEGATANWRLVLSEVLEDSLLRNQQWRLELSLVQDERVAQDEIQSPAKFKPVPYSPRTSNLKGIALDRLGLFAWKGRALYVRRWSRDMPSGVGSRILSTYARKRDDCVDTLTAKTSRDRILHTIGVVGRNLPVKRGLALFESHMGTQYSDSPRAIFEALRAQRPDLEVFWSVADTSAPTICPTHLVRRHSDSYAMILARAATVVDNQGFPSYYQRRGGQLYLQTWHGVPLKQMGRSSAVKSESELREIQRSVANWSLTFAPSSYYQEHLNEAMFYNGPVLKCGLPRNDRLVNYTDADRIAALRRLHLDPRKRYLLWAPTFRERGRLGVPKVEDMLNLSSLIGMLPDDVVLLTRPHYLNRFEIPRELTGRVQDVSDIDEVSELYLACDLLITDYSSVMFDFAYTGKPIVIFAPDYEDYKEAQRGIIFDIAEEAPGPFVLAQEELPNAIEIALEEGAVKSDKYEQFVLKYVGSRKGGASEMAAKKILEWIE
ncbi:bifunctional glycosyltransferase/CDP-glycerol:glycerophosphate glycerophosphotransferase [Corynebacterium pseudogenitalium]|uniref:bifunctional glycosyltransferase/CDP-glycerol:glycerophosphate glycerophosphotransferase n=1 Tax=Corynebacterium pseudogenitalium TaxID=38303 RepID=UPI003BA2F4FA